MDTDELLTGYFTTKLTYTNIEMFIHMIGMNIWRVSLFHGASTTAT